jgi:hypothetical protein
MLGKLLKYEFKDLGRILLPIYLAIIAAAGIFGGAMRYAVNESGTSAAGILFWTGGKTRYNAASSTLLTIYVVLSIVLVVSTFMLVIQRFTKNIYGSEGYLTLSLPVKISTQISAKTVSAAIWSVLSMIAIILSVIVVIAAAAGPSVVTSAIHALWDTAAGEIGAGHTAGLIIEGVILIMMSAAQFVSKIYASIALGHRLSIKHSMIAAVGVFIAVTAAESFISSLISFRASTVYNFFLTASYKVGDGTLHIIMLMLIAASFAMTFIFWLITWSVMRKHLDLR